MLENISQVNIRFKGEMQEAIANNMCLNDMNHTIRHINDRVAKIAIAAGMGQADITASEFGDNVHAETMIAGHFMLNGRPINLTERRNLARDKNNITQQLLSSSDPAALFNELARDVEQYSVKARGCANIMHSTDTACDTIESNLAAEESGIAYELDVEIRFKLTNWQSLRQIPSHVWTQPLEI